MPASALYRHFDARLEVERHGAQRRHIRGQRAAVLRGDIRLPSRVPAPPVSRPLVCVIRSRIVISRSAGTV